MVALGLPGINLPLIEENAQRAWLQLTRLEYRETGLWIRYIKSFKLIVWQDFSGCSCSGVGLSMFVGSQHPALLLRCLHFGTLKDCAVGYPYPVYIGKTLANWYNSAWVLAPSHGREEKTNQGWIQTFLESHPDFSELLNHHVKTSSNDKTFWTVSTVVFLRTVHIKKLKGYRGNVT